MPELPWRKWYPQDWKSDPQLSRCSASTRGIWADAVSTMMQQNTFKIEGTDDELAKDCRCLASEIQAAHDDLKRNKAAEVSMQNGCKIWVCRRLLRERKLSELRSKSASSRWNKTDANTHANTHAKPMQDPMQRVDANTHAPSASAYASASVSASVPIQISDHEKKITQWFARKPNQILSYSEQTGFFEISKRPDLLEEILELDGFRRKNKNYFPQSLQSLLSQWDATLDRARTHDERESKNGDPKPKSNALLLKLISET